jgi:hypothetical protein
MVHGRKTAIIADQQSRGVFNLSAVVEVLAAMKTLA